MFRQGMVCLFALLLGILPTGCKDGAKPSSPAGEKKPADVGSPTKVGNQGQSPQDPKGDKVQQNADLKLSADELLADLRGNQLAAERKYKGKTLEVTGLVENADTALLPELDPQYFVWLRGRDKAGGSIRAGFSKWFDGFGALNPGGVYLNRKGGAGIPVTVHGKLEWRENEARLGGCSMVTTEDEILARLKTKDSAEKDATDQAERNAEDEVRQAQAVKVKPSDLIWVGGAKHKFAGKVVEVAGVVKAVRKGKWDENSGESIYVQLEWDKNPTDSPHTVECGFAMRHADRLAKIQPGQTVTIRGRCREFVPSSLWQCVLLSTK